MPMPRKKIDFVSQVGDFGCIMGTTFYSSAIWFKRKEAVLLGLDNLLLQTINETSTRRDANTARWP